MRLFLFVRVRIRGVQGVDNVPKIWYIYMFSNMKPRNIILAVLAVGSVAWFAVTASTTASQAVPQSASQYQSYSVVVPTKNQAQNVPVKEPIAPNGTYTNSKGNDVPRPYIAPSIPVGATAQCRDGSYSFSQSRRGTCSSHGGIRTWL